LQAQVADNAQIFVCWLVGSVKMLIIGVGIECLRTEEVEKCDTFPVTESGNAVFEGQYPAAWSAEF
jgi:hypothetical protein